MHALCYHRKELLRLVRDVNSAEESQRYVEELASVEDRLVRTRHELDYAVSHQEELSSGKLHVSSVPSHSLLLSPARRGRGILVVPGFCLASGVTFFCGCKNYWSNLFEISTWHS